MADEPREDKTADISGDPGENLGLEKTDVLPPATVVGGKYRLGRLIGEGGMGAVYEAEHTGLGVNVAVKLLNEAFTSDEKAVTRFRREARAAAAIRHPNIVEVTDTGTDEDGIPFIVMELLEGESLSALLRRERVLAPPTAVVLTSQILAGLAAAHAKGVVHRDLKPGNILLARQQDGSYMVKILDFGISKFFADNVPQDVTAAGAVIGTPRFMAPEQAVGQPDLDARVDLYSASVLLYRMVTGRLPFNARTPEGIIQALLEGKATAPTEIRPELSPALEAVVLKGMATNRELRFQDARQFLQALQEAVPEAAGVVLQLSLPVGRSSDSGANPTPTASGTYSGGVGVPTSSTMFPAPGATGPLPPGSMPTLVKEGGGRPRYVALVLVLLIALGGGLGWYLYGRSVQSGVPPAAADAGPKYGGPRFKLGITKYLPRHQLEKEHSNLVRYLADTLERDVQLVVHEDYIDLAAELSEGKLDLAALSSYNYVRAKRRWPELYLLATHVTESGSSYEGFVVTRANSGIRALEDLRGRIFCYVNPTSTSGYLYPRALFRKSGIDPDKDLKAARFTGDHISALKALAQGACDGTAVFTGVFFEARKHGLTPEKYTVVATTDRIPYDAYCASPTLKDAKIKEIGDALLALVPDSKLARKVLGPKSRITGFVKVEDKAYDAVRDMEPYKDKPAKQKPRPDEKP